MTSADDHLMSWMRGAHAMDMQTLQMVRVRTARKAHHSMLSRCAFDPFVGEAVYGQRTRRRTAGDDTIYGREGSDTMTGGAGRDRFVVEPDAAGVPPSDDVEWVQREVAQGGNGHLRLVGDGCMRHRCPPGQLSATAKESVMAKAPSRTTRKTAEIEPFDKRKVELAKARPELSAKDLQKLTEPGRFPFLAIETLTPTKTVGRARTNLTLIAPTVFQTDAAVPRASFDVRAQTRKPGAQMHFQPSGYGITSVATYVMEFTLETFGQSTFNLQGGPFTVNILNAGTKTLNGLSSVALVFKDLPPSSEVFGFLEQTSGAVWNWFSIGVRFPDLVIGPA